MNRALWGIARVAGWMLALVVVAAAIVAALRATAIDDADRDFLKAGGVFTDDFIDAYIGLKMKEVTAFRAATHPLEYQMYYAI